MKKILILSIAATFLLSSCAAVFMGKKQKVVFNTGSSDAEVYLNNEMIGEGSTFTTKVDKTKGQSQQVTVKRKGYKDQYSAIVKTRRPIAFWPIKILFFWNYYGMVIDRLRMDKNTAFDREVNLEGEENKLVIRGKTDKFIDISNMKVNIKNTKKDFVFFTVKYDPKNLKKSMEAAELKKDTKDAKAEAKKAKKGKKTKTLNAEDDVKADDTKYSYNVYQTLRKTGFVDTVNKVFQDNNNTLVLEGKINKISTFSIHTRFHAIFYKSKVYLTWYVKNTYDEIIDSLVTTELSGEFSEIATYESSEWKYDGFEKMVGDAIDISYLKLHQSSKLSKYLKMESDFKIKDALLTIKAPASKVTDKESASEACVTIKLKEGTKDVGHGSGFAISQDGYIVTNYHVVAGKYPGKYNDLTVVDAEGVEMPAKVIRTNKYRDLALIKVEGKFTKGFAVSNVKGFKKMQDVFTIGTPKSIELGQSISAGLISNERKTESTNLLQLGMSVNGGNSGGPLFDATGALHGVIVSKLVGSNTEGVGFAIPGYLIADYLNINFN
ncbi:MAG: serine protease [Bacteroidetes bacterium]|nr:serine protease [Bacteroidota bacterium]